MFLYLKQETPHIAMEDPCHKCANKCVAIKRMKPQNHVAAHGIRSHLEAFDAVCAAHLPPTLPRTHCKSYQVCLYFTALLLVQPYFGT